MLNSFLLQQLADAHRDDLLRDAARQNRRAAARRAAREAAVGAEVPITIRFARPDDQRALARLAQLDSACLPAGPLLIAEVADDVRVALSMSDGAAIADPFHRTAVLQRLLRTSAVYLLNERRRRGPRRPWRREQLGRS